MFSCVHASVRDPKGGREFTHVLHSDKIRTDERDVVHLTEHSDHTGVIDTGDQYAQKIGQQRWLLLEVESQSLVIARHKEVNNDPMAASQRWYLHLNICHPDNHFLELVVFPGIGRPFDHGKSSIVLTWMSVDDHPLTSALTYKLIILDVQQDEFWPEMSLFGGPDDLGDVDTSNEELQVLHHYCQISPSFPMA